MSCGLVIFLDEMILTVNDCVQKTAIYSCLLQIRV